MGMGAHQAVGAHEDSVARCILGDEGKEEELGGVGLEDEGEVVATPGAVVGGAKVNEESARNASHGRKQSNLRAARIHRISLAPELIQKSRKETWGANVERRPRENVRHPPLSLSFGGDDPMAFSGPAIGGDSPALFLLSTGTGIGAPSGKCNISGATHSDEQGCCSGHGGVAPDQLHYPGGPVTCADFSISRSCTWK